jgi:hypothetical protein
LTHLEGDLGDEERGAGAGGIADGDANVGVGEAFERGEESFSVRFSVRGSV